MKIKWSDEYMTNCIVIEEGDQAEDVIETAVTEDCFYDEGDEICCNFRGFSELYTEEAIRRSLP